MQSAECLPNDDFLQPSFSEIQLHSPQVQKGKVNGPHVAGDSQSDLQSAGRRNKTAPSARHKMMAQMPGKCVVPMSHLKSTCAMGEICRNPSSASLKKYGICSLMVRSMMTTAASHKWMTDLLIFHKHDKFLILWASVF